MKALGWRRRLGGVVAVIAITLSACGSDTTRLDFRITYPDAATYRERQPAPALAVCTAMPGARFEGELKSMAPIDLVSIEGAPDAARRFQDCLEGIPNATVRPIAR